MLVGGLRDRHGAGTNGVIVRHADAKGVADLRAGPGELVVVLTVDVLQEGVRVDEEAQSLTGDHADR
ncbi:hypothetical protein D9M71_320480 [compost metagenome]